MITEMDISMSVYSDQCFNREKAVLLSAELLRDAGVAFFPIDVKRLLASFRQLYLFPYSTIGDRSDPEKRAAAIAALPSKDGFCTRIHDVLIDFGDGPVDGYNWNIYYNDSSLEARIRFTLMHELGHVLLGHHQTLNTDTITGKEDDPEYRAADAQADQFSINILAPAPAVFQLLKEHGFSCLKATGGRWKLTNRNAPFLRYLGKLPDPVELITVAFGLSQAAAERRLAELNDELAIWLDLDERLYHFITGMAHRSGWYCWVCNTRRRTTSPYCPGCGKGWDYIYKDHGRFSRPVMSLRKNGQFAFCSVCGNTEFPDDAAFCPVCGCPVINECENAYHTDGDFIRSGMHIVRGTHRCRPTDIYCGTCGVLTAFGAQHGPKKNMWLPGRKNDRCRTHGTAYPAVLPTKEGRLLKCPSCGSKKTIRDGRYCAECRQPLENCCVSDGAGSHACDPNDRYCRICGRPTIFYQAGFLPAYTETEAWTQLRAIEAKASKHSSVLLMLQCDGSMTIMNREAR